MDTLLCDTLGLAELHPLVLSGSDGLGPPIASSNRITSFMHRTPRAPSRYTPPPSPYCTGNLHPFSLGPRGGIASHPALRKASHYAPRTQQNRVYPYPLGAGSVRPNPKMGAPDPENPLFLRVFCAQRGTETMVSDHGLGGKGQTMG